MKRQNLITNAENLSSNLSYLVGVMFGDGYLQKDYISLETNDKDFADSFVIACFEQFGIEPKVYVRKGSEFTDWRNGKTYTRKDRYVVRCLSRNVSDFVKSIRNINFVKSLPFEYKIDWLRGYWDSDGNVAKYQVQFTQKDYAKIQLYADVIKETLDIDVHIKKRKNQNIYYAYFGQKKQIQKFTETVKPTIKRKVEKLNKIYK